MDGRLLAWGAAGVCPPDAVAGPISSSLGPPGPRSTNLRRVFPKLGISARRQPRHCPE